MEYLEDGHLELYNLRDDIGEKNDLSSKYPDRTKALLKMLHDWRTTVGAKMPTPNPDYKPAR